MSFIVKLPQQGIRGIPGVHYVSTPPCLSDDNDFIPVLSLMDGEIVTVNRTGERKFLYQLNVPMRYHSFVNRYTHYLHNLEFGDLEWRNVKVRSLPLDNYYLCNAGSVIVMDKEYELKPLMLMCVRTSQIFSLDRQANQLEKFTLIIDNSFINNELHFKLFRNTKKYIESVSEAGVNVLYTNDINKVCLSSRPVERPVFVNLDEMLGYSKTLNEELLNS